MFQQRFFSYRIALPCVSRATCCRKRGGLGSRAGQDPALPIRAPLPCQGWGGQRLPSHSRPAETLVQSPVFSPALRCSLLRRRLHLFIPLPGLPAAPQHPRLCPGWRVSGGSFARGSLRFCRGPGSAGLHHALLHWFLSELLYSLSSFITFNLTLALIGINITVPCVREPLVSVLQDSFLLPAPVLLFPSRSTTGCSGGVGLRC